MVVSSVLPGKILPLEPQESAPNVKEAAVTPAPGDAVPEPLEGIGEETENPGGKVHWAMDRPETHAGAAGALFTVNGSVAKLPVSKEPTKR